MLATVLILAVVLVLILVAVLVLVAIAVLILVAVLVIHVPFLRKYLSAVCRRDILPGKSGFILGFEYKTCQ